LIVFR